jgi:hypothetical protein
MNLAAASAQLDAVRAVEVFRAQDDPRWRQALLQQLL